MKILHWLTLLAMLLYPPVSATKLNTAINQLPTIQEGYHSINRQSLYYKTIGENDKPPILMIHGGPGFDHHHMLSLDALGKEYQLIFYDQRGSGNSIGEVSPKSITMDNFISDLDGIRKAFNIEKADIVATSFGGLIALFYAVHYPERVNSLTLIASVPARKEDFSGVGQSITARASDQDIKRLKHIQNSMGYKAHKKSALQEYYRIFFKAYAYKASDAAKLNLDFGQYTAQNMNLVNMLMYEDLGQFDLYPQLSRIVSPTLILHGDTDPFPHQSVEKIHKAIKNSKYRLYKNTGHFLYLERPKQLFKDIHTFLQQNIDNAENKP